MTMQSINPSTHALIKEYAETPLNEINAIIKKSHHAFLSWKKTDFQTRSNLFKKTAQKLRDQSHSLATLMATEMGKPLKQGEAEIEKCAWCCDYFADNAAHFLQPELVSTDATKSFISYQPLGVIFAVMPWNFPFWQVFRFAAPALMAGNTALLKHASNVSGCALAIEKIFHDAGFPEHCFSTILINSKTVSEVIENSLIAAVTLTGSTAAGKSVASIAGRTLKKTVLELGGSDPYIILEDADLENAATVCVTSRLINSGQSCIAAKRFIVVEFVREKFESLIVKKMQDNIVGDPLDTTTTIGPLARHDLRDELHHQVQQSIEKGARCLLGGKIPQRAGAFYPPTVLTNVTKGMPAYDEELFGPVAAIISAKNEQEAIAIANDSIYGLGAALFTRDLQKGEKIASEELQAGSCFINALVRSDPRLPFGGIKQSGYGRELSHHGIKEFVNVKTVYVK